MANDTVVLFPNHSNRTGRRGRPPKGPRVPSDAGPLTRATWLEINELELSGREYDRWREQAIMAATAADKSHAEAKMAHFNPAIKVLNEAMDRLHAMKRRGQEGNGDDLLGGMGSFGTSGS